MILFFSVLIIAVFFALGWVSRFTTAIDRGLIALTVLILGFTPMVATGIAGMENGPNFHNRDFIGPWVWAFEHSPHIIQDVIAISLPMYFLGKLLAFIYLVSRDPK